MRVSVRDRMVAYAVLVTFMSGIAPLPIAAQERGGSAGLGSERAAAVVRVEVIATVR